MIFGGITFYPRDDIMTVTTTRRVETRVRGGYLNRWLLRKVEIITETKPRRDVLFFGDTGVCHSSVYYELKKAAQLMTRPPYKNAYTCSSAPTPPPLTAKAIEDLARKLKPLMPPPRNRLFDSVFDSNPLRWP